MKTTTIYLKLEKGELTYRDSQNHSGKTITSHLAPGGKVIWKLDRCSSIDDITNISLSGDTKILKTQPKKIDFDFWEADGADHGEGVVSYKVEVKKCSKCADEDNGDESLRDPKPPVLRMP